MSTMPQTPHGSHRPPATTTVVKLGGSCLDTLDDPWWDDLARLARERPLILVHGWSRPLQQLDPRHRPPSAMLRDRYGNQSRWTTPQVLDDIKTVSAALSEEIRHKLRTRAVTTRRLLGSDGMISAGPAERLWWRDRELVELDNLVGPPIGVNPAPLRHAQPGHIPLLTPLARNPSGQEVNTDADRAAAAVAAAVAATDLVLVTDVSHLMVDGRPVGRISAKTAAVLRDTIATGGMRKKLRAADEALGRGVERVVIGNGLLSHLLTADADADADVGTVIARG
ncbi:acetylglutamate kinase [Streptomyces sp. Je 1-369]|uniref:amino acid kinase family protein n=1 Tax=Streptomyces sp. Je 1-369 TaxID=2966192 RepID=UPI0022866013|nr:acetylglutamate kinase [Streptomyces sp. Je 1-369]WAL93167.1 acetylglutamate kinase [Streptomyces sp. Je 1-369]